MSRLLALLLLLFAALPAPAMRFSSMPEYRGGMIGYAERFWLTDPQRWTNNDPIGELGGINLTVGMNNNPLRYVDPLGLQAFEEFEPEREARENFRTGARNGYRSREELFYEEKEREASAELMRAYGRDPNQTYIGARPEDVKPTTPTSCPVGTPVYRVFGDKARGMGDWWTTANPATTPNFRSAAGLWPNNSGNWVAEGTVNNNTGITVGTAEPGPTTAPGQAMVPQILFQPGTASSQVTVNAVYNVESPH